MTSLHLLVADLRYAELCARPKVCHATVPDSGLPEASNPAFLLILPHFRSRILPTVLSPS
jgi:hypothetical protein